jgi:hypothetical protein
MKTAAVLILAAMLAGCVTSGPATIDAECKVFHDPGFAVQGRRLKDKQYIGRFQETGITVCNWKRPNE